jgi:AcrR family transcriptional regulator
MKDMSRGPAEGRRARRQRETRAALLEAALVLLRERGIYDVRVEDITGRADVGKGVFYNYFDSKEALVACLVSEGVEVLERDYLQELLAEDSQERRIDAIARRQEAFFDDHPEFAIAFHQARGLLLLGGEDAQQLHHAFAEYLRRLSRYIPGVDDPSAFATEDLLDIAAGMVGAAAGYRSFCIAIGRPIRVETISQILRGGITTVLEARRRKGRGRKAQTKRPRSKK